MGQSWQEIAHDRNLCSDRARIDIEDVILKSNNLSDLAIPFIHSLV